MRRQLNDPRKLNRWKKYNYNNAGYYFITICLKNRLELFGNIKGGEMILNNHGKIAEKYWQMIPDYYNNVTIDEFVVMPNHIHGIIIVHSDMMDYVDIDEHGVGTGHCPVLKKQNPVPKYGLLSKIVNSYKNATTKQIHQQFSDYEFQWQRSFHDRIIRNQQELNNIRRYIIYNPKMWDRDRNNQHARIT